MGTRCTITLYAKSERDAAKAATAAFEEIARVESILTDYNPDSEAMRVMRGNPNQWHAISPTLHDVLLKSFKYYQASHGAFDPTIGACTHLWRMTTRAGRLPTEQEQADALAHSGFDKVNLDTDQSRILFATRNMILDFGGIGKGYAADRALEALNELGIHSAMIDLGGDIVLGDPPPDQPKGWRVEIRMGFNETSEHVLANCAVATSGDLEQHFIHNNQRYSHILDPATGFGITHPIAVTVIAPDSTSADAIASIVSVIGTDWSIESPGFQSSLPLGTIINVVSP